MTIHYKEIAVVKRATCRYRGGKWKLADWVISHFPPHRFYAELFGGGGSVLMRKPRSRGELFNDLDSEVVNYFQVLRNPEQSRLLKNLLELTPYAREEFKFSYSAPADDDPVEKARRFFVRLSHGWGTNAECSKRAFRTRRGTSEATPAIDFANFPQHIKSFTERLRGVVIESRPAIELLKIHDGPDVLFYCDPPYVQSTRRQGPWAYISMK